MLILKQSIQDTLQVAGEETFSNNNLAIVIIILSVFILIFFLIRDSRSKGKKQPEENKPSEQPDSQKERTKLFSTTRRSS
jgi:flagellar biosynthesis/type III secretory pathway M-ring protein FliF/YscJ